MSSPLPTVSQLIASVDATELTDLDRVRAAVVMADDLGTLGDQVVSHFVETARRSGCSWSQIGEQLGVSKQAAQQAFVSPAPRRGRFGRRPGGRPHGRWSDQAGLMLKAAVEEAGALGHDYVGTEHLLLALIHGDGVAAVALRRLGVEHQAVSGHVIDVIGRGEGKATGHRPFTPRTKKVIELAAREAIRLQHDHVRTEHLLLALVREGDGIAAQILVKYLGLDLPDVTRTVLEVVNKGGGPRTPGAPPTA